MNTLYSFESDYCTRNDKKIKAYVVQKIDEIQIENPFENRNLEEIPEIKRKESPIDVLIKESSKSEYKKIEKKPIEVPVIKEPIIRQDLIP